MIQDADKMNSNANSAEASDGKVSFDEFKNIALNGERLKTFALWKSVQSEVILTKGIKQVMKRLEEQKKKNTFVESGSKPPSNSSSDDLMFAMKSASVGLSILTVATIFRKVVMKI